MQQSEINNFLCGNSLWQHLQMKPKSAIFIALDYLCCLLGLQQTWIRESEIQFSSSLYTLLANWRPYTAVTQFLNFPIYPSIESTQIISIYLLKALGGTQREKKTKTSLWTQSILVRCIRKGVRKGDWKLKWTFFSFKRKYFSEKAQYLYYVHMQGVYHYWGRK